MTDIAVTWFDHQRAPQCAPDPAYPNGRDIDMRPNRTAKGCTVEVPCPAPRCGLYLLVCRSCGLSAAVTTAGRPDDPRKVTVPCKLN